MGYMEALRMELLMLGTPLPISIVMPVSVDTQFRKHNRGPRPKMTAEMCADLAVAGWERGDYRIYCPTHACFMVSIPPLFGQWTMDTFMTSSEQPALRVLMNVMCLRCLARLTFVVLVDQRKLFEAFVFDKSS